MQLVFKEHISYQRDRDRDRDRIQIHLFFTEHFMYCTLTSVLLNARKVVVVSNFSLISGFFISGSFTAGATETTAGAGF